MTLPRTAAEVLADRVVFEVECIDRMYLNVYVSQLQRELGLIGYLRSRLGCTINSTAPLADHTRGVQRGDASALGRSGDAVDRLGEGSADTTSRQQTGWH